MATNAVTSAPEPAKVGSVGRVFGVLFNPGNTYADIVRKPSWLAPIAVLTALSVIACYFVVRKVDWPAFEHRQVEKNPRNSNLTQEQKDAAAARNEKITVPLTWAIAAGGTLINALILTLVFWGGFNLFKGAGLRFGTSFAVTSYALMPAAIGTIVTIVALILKRAGEVDPQRVVATSLGAYWGVNTPKWLFVLGASLDLCWFWSLALLAIGYAAANPRKITTGSAFTVVVGMWLVFVLVKVGLAAVF